MKRNRSPEKINDSQSVMSVITKVAGSNPFDSKKTSESKQFLAKSIRNSNDFGKRNSVKRNRSDERINKGSKNNLKMAYDDQYGEFDVK